MKTCFKCNIEQSLTEFYAHPEMADGHLGKCKTCTKRNVQDNYRAKPEQFSAYERKRRDLPHRIAGRKEYAESEAGRISGNRAKRNWVDKNPEKRKAATAVRNALRDGRLFKSPCAVCGKTKVEGHHEDYSKPLEVIWLCKKHHWEADERRRERENCVSEPSRTTDMAVLEVR